MYNIISFIGCNGKNYIEEVRFSGEIFILYYVIFIAWYDKEQFRILYIIYLVYTVPTY